MTYEGDLDDGDVETILNTFKTCDFAVGATALCEWVLAIGYGSVTVGNNPGLLRVTTGGWSQVEYLLELVHQSLWGYKYWYATFRGGCELFYIGDR